MMVLNMQDVMFVKAEKRHDRYIQAQKKFKSTIIKNYMEHISGTNRDSHCQYFCFFIVNAYHRIHFIMFLF